MATNNLFKNNFVTALSAAFAATILAPIVVPAIKKSARPLAKSLIKGGISLYEKSREAAAYAGEAMEDVIAEVRAEEMEKHLAQANTGFADEREESEEGMHAEASPAQGNGGSRPGNGRGGAEHETRQGA
jgi:hypothetical protein